MKWWFSSWNLILFSLSKVCRIFSADCFYSGFTASQSPQLRLRSIVGYTLLISLLFRFAFASKVFSTLCTEKLSWKNHFQLVSDFIFLPPSFCFTLRFCSYESTKDKLSLYLIWNIRIRLEVFCKSFLPPYYNWKVTSRLSGYFTKIFICFLYLYWKSYT